MLSKILKLACMFVSLGNCVFSQAPSIQWQKCLGSTGGETCFSTASTIDGGSVILGSTQTLDGDVTDPLSGSEDFWVVKLDAAGNKIWDKTLGGSFDERGFAIQQASDGGYIVVGRTASNNTGDVGANHGGYDYWVVKLDAMGIIMWQKTYGGTGDDLAYAVQQTNEGGYIVCGESDSNDGDITNAHGDRDYWVIKLDNLGNLIWQKSLGGSGIDYMATSIKQTTDGGYILTGGTTSSDGDVSNPNHIFGIAWIVKINEIGNIQWQRTYGSLNGAETGYGICQTSDGGYAATGICYANSGNVTGNHGNSDFWVIKLDTAGNLLWQKSFGGSIQDEPKYIIQAEDGSLIVSGWTASSNGDITGNNGGGDYWVVKVSITGVLQWQKSIGGNSLDESFCITQTLDHGYLIAGNATSNNSGDVGNNHGNADMWIVKLTPATVVPVTFYNFAAIARENDAICKWNTIQEQNSSRFIVQRSLDGSAFIDAGTVLAAGNSSLPLDYNFSDKNALLINTDFLYYRLKIVDIDGEFVYSKTEKIKLKSLTDISLYPNPAIDNLAIKVISSTNESAPMIIYNSIGEKVFEQQVNIMKAVNTINIDIHKFRPDSYCVTIKTKNPSFSRFIKVSK